MRIEYERFAHSETPTTLTLRFGPSALRGGEARLWLERRYLERMTVRQVWPQPERVELGTERLTYVFAARGASATRFFRQFVYP